MNARDSFGALMPMLSYKAAVEPIRDVLTFLDAAFDVRSFAIGSALRYLWRGDAPNECVIYVPLHPARTEAVLAALETLEAYREAPVAFDVVCRVRTPEVMLRRVREDRDRIAMTATEDLITDAFLAAMEIEQ